jgi:hypothetical protein
VLFFVPLIEILLYAQSVDYYLAPFRISKPTYVWHLLDIIRAPIGRPLLLQLAKTPEKIADLLTIEPVQNSQVLPPLPP